MLASDCFWFIDHLSATMCGYLRADLQDGIKAVRPAYPCIMLQGLRPVGASMLAASNA